MLPDSKSLQRAMDQISIVLLNRINEQKIKVQLTDFVDAIQTHGFSPLL